MEVSAALRRSITRMRMRELGLRVIHGGKDAGGFRPRQVIQGGAPTEGLNMRDGERHGGMCSRRPSTAEAD